MNQMEAVRLERQKLMDDFINNRQPQRVPIVSLFNLGLLL